MKMLLYIYPFKYKIEYIFRCSTVNSSKSEPISQSTPVFRDISINRINGNAMQSVILIGLENHR